MQRATISEVKNRLSALLRKVRAGETVLILDRDQPVARLERVSAPSTDQRLAALERAGLVRRAQGTLPPDLLEEPPVASKKSVLEALLEDRREGR